MFSSFTADVAHDVLRSFTDTWPARIQHQYWGLDRHHSEILGYEFRETEIVVTDTTRIDRWNP